MSLYDDAVDALLAAVDRLALRPAECREEDLADLAEAADAVREARLGEEQDPATPCDAATPVLDVPVFRWPRWRAPG
jgi:hypothetical protein